MYNIIQEHTQNNDKINNLISKLKTMKSKEIKTIEKGKKSTKVDHYFDHEDSFKHRQRQIINHGNHLIKVNLT